MDTYLKYMKNILFVCLSVVTLFHASLTGRLMAGPPSSSSCGCVSNAAPNLLSAVVDGSIAEWNISPGSPDYWASLYNAGKSDTNFSGYALTANSYLRYQFDPVTSNVTAFVLVLTSDPENYPALVEDNNAWASIDGLNGKLYTGATGNNGTAPDFAWVGVGYDNDPTHALGYEASFTLPASSIPRSCFVVHVEAYNKIAGAAQTSGTESFSGIPAKCLIAGVPDNPPPPPGGCETLSVQVNSAEICKTSQGTLVASASGGTGPYTYLWSSGETASSISVSLAGKYTVYIADANGCVASASGTVSYTTTTLSGKKFYDTNGNGIDDDENVVQGITITLSGDGIEAQTTQTSENGTYAFSGLLPGTYTVSETLPDGWMSTTPTSQVVVVECSPATGINFGNLLKVTPSATKADVPCRGESAGSIDLSVIGGVAPYTYLWSNGSTNEDLSGLAAGTYSVTVTDAKGNEGSLSVVISEPETRVSVSVGNAEVCKGSSTTMTATVSGGAAPYSYLWSNGATTPSIEVSVAGTYSVSVTDANSCSTSGSGKLVYKTATLSGRKFYDANANGLDDDNQVVAGVEITLVGGGITLKTLTLQDGSYTFTGLLPGNYTVSETVPVGWMNTTPISQTVTVGCDPVTGINFGNLRLGKGGGLTLGYWSNKNGENSLKTTGGGTTANLQYLQALNLRDKNTKNPAVLNGDPFDPATYTNFRDWLLNANAANMAYMLSAQMSATALNVRLNPVSDQSGVRVGGVSGGAIVYAPGTKSANALGFAKINDLLSEANAELSINGLTITQTATRSYQEALKIAFDKANNNLNFVQPAP